MLCLLDRGSQVKQTTKKLVDKVDVDELINAIRGLGFGDGIEVLADFIRASYGHSTMRFNPIRTAIPDEPLFQGTSCDLSLLRLTHKLRADGEKNRGVRRTAAQLVPATSRRERGR